MESDRVLREVGRVVAGECAPDEAPLYEVMADRFFADPGLAAVPKAPDREVGSGVDVPTLILTFVILPVLRSALESVLRGASDALRDLTKEQVVALLKPRVKELLRLHREKVAALPESITREPGAREKLANIEAYYERLRA